MNDEQKPAKFNQALAKLARLDKIHQECHVARWDGRLSDWERRLRSLYSELREWVLGDARKNLDNMFGSLNELATHHNYMVTLNYDNPYIIIPNDFEVMLDKIEKTLFQIEHDAKLSIPYAMDGTDAIEY